MPCTMAKGNMERVKEVGTRKGNASHTTFYYPYQVCGESLEETLPYRFPREAIIALWFHWKRSFMGVVSIVRLYVLQLATLSTKILSLHIGIQQNNGQMDKIMVKCVKNVLGNWSLLIGMTSSTKKKNHLQWLLHEMKNSGWNCNSKSDAFFP